MTSTEPQDAAERRLLPKLAALLAASIMVLGLALLGLWLARESVAQALARQWFGRQGVASSIRFGALGFTNAEARVRLGLPSDPDLTIDRLEVGYRLVGPWSGKLPGIEVARVRMIRPRLKARLSGGSLSVGSLDPVIKDFLSRPPSHAPPPDIDIVDGEARLLSPGGALQMHGDASLRAGAFTSVKGGVDPFDLRTGSARITSAGGRLTLRHESGGLALNADFGPIEVSNNTGSLRVEHTLLAGQAPYPSDRGRVLGAMRLALTASAVSGVLGDWRARGGDVTAVFRGGVDADGDNQAINGRVSAVARLASATAPGADGGLSTARLDLWDLVFSHDATGVVLATQGQAIVGLGRLQTPTGRLARVSGAARLQGGRLQWRDGVMSARGQLAGRLAGEGGLAAAASGALMRSASLRSASPAYAAAAERALRAFRFDAPAWRVETSDGQIRLALPAPLRIAAGSGARLTLAAGAEPVTWNKGRVSGAAGLNVGGGGLPDLHVQVAQLAWGPNAWRANVHADGVVDASIAHAAQFAIDGRAAMSGSRVRFDLIDCAPVSVRRLDLKISPVTNIVGRLCPNGGPLLEADPALWRVRGRIEGGGADATEVAVQVGAINGVFDAAGGAEGVRTATIGLDHLGIRDTGQPLRFLPVAAAGRLVLDQTLWRGDFAATTHAGLPIGTIALRQDMASGIGRIDLDARGLTFAPGALQPADLTPLAAFARDAAGSAAFTGWFAWSPKGAGQSGGELVAKDLNFKSPLGPVVDIDSHLRFTSLAPLMTAPGQRLTVKRVDAIVPLSGLAGIFDLAADAAHIQTASTTLAKGVVTLAPMTAPFAPKAAYEGDFTLDRVDLGEIIAATSLAKAVKLTAVVSGDLRLRVSPEGAPTLEGRLAAVGPGRLSIARTALTGVAASPVAPSAAAAGAQANFAQDLAYQAMDNLAFDQMDATLQSAPNDRLRILFHINGRHDPPTRQRAVIRLFDLLRGQALARPMALPSDTQIDLTLDTSLNFGELVRALGEAWRQSTTIPAPGRSAVVQGPGPKAAKP